MKDPKKKPANFATLPKDKLWECFFEIVEELKKRNTLPIKKKEDG